MVKISCVTTRGGDQGQTSLGNGQRVSKNDLRIAAIGEVDELNSFLGLAIFHTPDADMQKILRTIQNDLFDMGADLCRPDEHTNLKMTHKQVGYLEEKIASFNAMLPPLTSFVLPGGSIGSTYLHLVRTITRRAERTCVALNQTQSINDAILLYLNRLSDLAFVLARFANKLGTQGDVLWVPGENR